MALNCNELNADILSNCDETSTAGLEANAVFIKRSDIDYATSVYDTVTGTITNLATKPGTTGYVLEGIKQMFGASSELVPKETSLDKFKHLFSGVILSPSTVNKRSANDLKDDLYVVVVEKKYKGVADVDAFEILGWKHGLRVQTMVWNSQEDDGIIKFEAMSVEGQEEETLPINLIETDYTTTLAAFVNKFATAAIP